MQTPVIAVQIMLPQRDYRAFAAAVRLLRHSMGDRAPDVPTLVLHNLGRRDAAGLAEEYLESVNWPVTRSELPATKRHHLSPLRLGAASPGAKSSGDSS